MAQTVCFAPFFFLNFGLNKLFWPIRLESTRFSANQPKSEPLRHELAKKKKTTWQLTCRSGMQPDMRAAASLACRCVPPHQTSYVLHRLELHFSAKKKKAYGTALGYIYFIANACSLLPPRILNWKIHWTMKINSSLWKTDLPDKELLNLFFFFFFDG